MIRSCPRPILRILDKWLGGHGNEENDWGTLRSPSSHKDGRLVPSKVVQTRQRRIILGVR